MKKKTGRSIPWQLIVLDLVGAFLFAVGLLRFIGDGGGFLYMVAGIVLMTPLILHILKIPKKSNKKY